MTESGAARVHPLRRWCDGLFNRVPYLYTWERRWWTVTTPWNYHLPFRTRLLYAVRWKLPRWLGGWWYRGLSSARHGGLPE